MADPLRLVFMGSDPLALPLLDWLSGEGGRIATIVAVLTGPDRPAGRGQAVKPNAVASWAMGRPFEVLKPEAPDSGTVSALSALRPDLSLVVAYGHLLRDNLISVPRLGTLNLHASLLPRYRGASPIQAAISSGDSRTGMTLMRIVRELDAGPVADVETVDILPLDTGAEVEAKLAACSIPLLARALPRLARGELEFRGQDPSLASYCRRLAKPDGVIDFALPASVLAARINALHPWPVVTVDLAGAPVRLGLADTVAGIVPAAPGTVVDLDSDGLLVATGSGILRLLRLQRPGGRMLGAAEFLRGFPVASGTQLASKPMPAFLSDAPFRR
jgi:methionyl-tRNA formyltransferase